MCLFIHLLPSSCHRRRKHKRKHKRAMNPQQAPQPRSQGLTDDQQAQWQQQFQQQQHQQPMPGLQHPQPQHYAPVPDLSTPQLDTMYPQGAQGHEQLYGQQDPAQNPQQFFGHQQMPQTPQAFAQPPPQQQQAQFGMPMDPAGQYYQQQPPPPDAQGFAYGGQQGVPNPQAAFNPATQAWEQANVTSVPTPSPFNQNQTPRPNAQQAQALRDAERSAARSAARQRIEALEDEHERQELQTALAISAMIAPGAEELEEQFKDQLHKAEMDSLEIWERNLRRQFEQQGEAGYENAGYAHMDPDAVSQQAQFYPGVSRSASVIDPASVRSPGPSEFSYAPDAQGGYHG
jgi:hypothetical protein